MISITELKLRSIEFPAVPPRTSELEQRISIGSGFHNKWYRNQREHMLGWLVIQECQCLKAGNDPSTVSSEGMWNRLKCSPLMYWLAECALVSSERLDEAERQAVLAAAVNPKDGNPHGKFMRLALPWSSVQAALIKQKPHVSQSVQSLDANNAFNRLIEKVPSYRRLKEWHHV